MNSHHKIHLPQGCHKAFASWIMVDLDSPCCGRRGWPQSGQAVAGPMRHPPDRRWTLPTELLLPPTFTRAAPSRIRKSNGSWANAIDGGDLPAGGGNERTKR